MNKIPEGYISHQELVNISEHCKSVVNNRLKAAGLKGEWFKLRKAVRIHIYPAREALYAVLDE